MGKVMDARDGLAHVYANKGDNKSAVSWIQKGLLSITHKYGENSIEVGNELQKLTDVMFQVYKQNGEMRDDLLKHVIRCGDIMKLHYGPWSPPYRDATKQLTL